MKRQATVDCLKNHWKPRSFTIFQKYTSLQTLKQRKFLDLYSRRYEIRVAQGDHDQSASDHRDTDPVDISPYREFFRRHSKLDIDRYWSPAAIWRNLSMHWREMNFMDHCPGFRTAKALFCLIMEWLSTFIIFPWSGMCVRNFFLKRIPQRSPKLLWREIRYAEPSVYFPLQALFQYGTALTSTLLIPMNKLVQRNHFLVGSCILWRDPVYFPQDLLRKEATQSYFRSEHRRIL